MEDFLLRLGQFTKNCPRLPSRTIMLRLAGSRSYNVYGPQSDWDWSGVYVLPLDDILSLSYDPQNDSRQGEAPDNYQLYEVRKFCQLLLRGNPTAIESLFCSRNIKVSQEWDDLRLIRHRFLTKQVVRNYIGYIRNQIKRCQAGVSVHTSGGRAGEKWLYHILRMAKDCLRIASGKEPAIWWDGDDRALLLRVRRRDIPTEGVLSLTEGILKSVEDAAAYPLPEEPDADGLNRWLLHVRGLKTS